MGGARGQKGSRPPVLHALLSAAAHSIRVPYGVLVCLGTRPCQPPKTLSAYEADARILDFKFPTSQRNAWESKYTCGCSRPYVIFAARRQCVGAAFVMTTWLPVCILLEGVGVGKSQKIRPINRSHSPEGSSWQHSMACTGSGRFVSDSR